MIPPAPVYLRKGGGGAAPLYWVGPVRMGGPGSILIYLGPEGRIPPSGPGVYNKYFKDKL